MKETKHIRQDFYSVAWVMPSGWDLGVLRVQESNSVPNEVCELLTCMGRATAKVNLALPTGALWRGQKVK